MSSCVIFGGSGYIGTKLAQHFLVEKRFEIIHIVDIKSSSLENLPGIQFHKGDVRSSIPIFTNQVEWVFNLAAIHREPGHVNHEYYNTNILGAQNVCEFATKVNCQNILFTSSISVYGPTIKATDEDTLTMPNTPYGISKLTAEYIHRLWLAEVPTRRLIMVRPGVIYGPGDPGNILRMIKAVKKGYFLLPTSPTIKKSYGYILGLIDSISFMMTQAERLAIYNYVEKETETLGRMIGIIKETLHYRGIVVQVPFLLLKAIASIIYQVNPRLNGIHPERVKKVARPTHIIPRFLITKNFHFRYDFRTSLLNWREISSDDFK